MRPVSLFLVGAVAGQASLWEETDVHDYGLAVKIEVDNKPTCTGLMRNGLVISTIKCLDHDKDKFKIDALTSNGGKTGFTEMGISGISWHKKWNTSKTYLHDFGFGILKDQTVKATEAAPLSADPSTLKLYAYRLNPQLALRKRLFTMLPLGDCVSGQDTMPKDGDPKAICTKPAQVKNPNSLTEQEMGTPLIAIKDKNTYIAGILTKIIKKKEGEIYLFTNVDMILKALSEAAKAPKDDSKNVIQPANPTQGGSKTDTKPAEAPKEAPKNGTKPAGSPQEWYQAS
ncbi:hypothetical protein DSO57_1018957 [Entomophthora muscae]|uniref:Uncharacterized protein n=1 Tax=Entomophthora muscae TaxID=34485 RepID=A0ACC2SSZ5_9FUNG|nr:hypothetical protein DSO57_1018957 [Entomophthora muscae]